MAEKRVYVCDVCGSEQSGSNHWFAVRFTSEGHILVGHLQRMIHTAEGPLAKELIHLCGEGCASKKVSEFLGAKG